MAKSSKRKPGRTMIAASRETAPAAKAAFHQLSGAGKSRIKRQFFGFSRADEQAILDLVDRSIREQLRKG